MGREVIVLFLLGLEMVMLKIALKRSYLELELIADNPSMIMFPNCVERLTINCTHLRAYPHTRITGNSYPSYAGPLRGLGVMGKALKGALGRP